MLVEQDVSEDFGDSNSEADSSSSTLETFQQQTRNERLLSLRKVKSRNAARTRRGKENYEFYELAKLLPIPTETSSQLDKASIIRLTMSYLKVREFALYGDPPWNVAIEGPPPNRTVKDMSKSRKPADPAMAFTSVFECYLGSHLLHSLDGFIFALNCQGKFIYISETISMYLGLSQVEMIGSSIFDYIHPADQDDLAIELGLTLSSAAEQSDSKNVNPSGRKMTRSFFIRMKSTLTRRGISSKSSCYKVVHVCTRVRAPQTNYLHVKKSQQPAFKNEKDTHMKDCKAQFEGPLGLYGIGTALPPPTINDISLENPMFVMRSNPALTFTYSEKVVQDILGYDVREVVGQSLYQCIHADDLKKLKLCHAEILNKGQMKTPYYRWLHKSGGYVWIHSCVTVLANQRLYPDQSFLWINYIISEHIDEKLVLDISQSSAVQVEPDEMHGHSCSDGVAEDCTKKQTEVQDSGESSKYLEHDENAKSNENAQRSNALLSDMSGSSKVKNSTKDPSCLTADGFSAGCTSQKKKLPVSNHLKNDKAQLALTIKAPMGEARKKARKGTDRDHSNNRHKEAEMTSDDNSYKVKSAVAIEETPMKCNSHVRRCKSATKTSDDSVNNEKELSLPPTTSTHSSKYVDSRKRSKDPTLVSPVECKKRTQFAKDVDNKGPNCDNKLVGHDKKVERKAVGPTKPGDTVHKPKVSTATTQSISEYLDADSVLWTNPPNKEISNHNDLPPGIKQMHGLWTVRHTPSAVHHHYPFGINPTLLHSNPVLAKIMMAGWGGYHQPISATDAAYVVTTPVQFMSSTQISQLGGTKFLQTPAILTQTPASVAAVLEELKKDPLHKVNPPNKVVIPNAEGGFSLPTVISGSKRLLHSYPSFNTTQSPPPTPHKTKCTETNMEAYPENAPDSTTEPQTSEAPNAISGNEHTKTQTLLQVPNTILMPTSGILLNDVNSSLLAVGPDTMLKLPLQATSFQRQRSPCVIQGRILQSYFTS